MKIKVNFRLMILTLSVILASCRPSQAALDEQATQTADMLASTRTQVYLDYQASKPTATLTATVTLTPTITPTPTKTLTPTPHPPLEASPPMYQRSTGWRCCTCQPELS
jgi:hypothetical protein